MKEVESRDDPSSKSDSESVQYEDKCSTISCQEVKEPFNESMTGMQIEEDNVKERLAMYERLFHYRYTEDDAEYMACLNSPKPPPPCVENWHSRPKRPYDSSHRGSYQGGGRDRGGGGGGGWRGARDGGWRDEDRSRGGGWRGGGGGGWRGGGQRGWGGNGGQGGYHDNRNYQRY